MRRRVERGPIRAVYLVHKFSPRAEVHRFYAADRWLGFLVHRRDPQGRISASSSPRCCPRCGHRTFRWVSIVQLRGRGAVGGPKSLRREEVEAMLRPQFANRPRLLKTDLPTDANEGRCLMNSNHDNDSKHVASTRTRNIPCWVEDAPVVELRWTLHFDACVERRSRIFSSRHWKRNLDYGSPRPRLREPVVPRGTGRFIIISPHSPTGSRCMTTSPDGCD